MRDYRFPSKSDSRVAVAGVSFYPAAFDLPLQSLSLELVAEPRNPHDTYAVSVRRNGVTVGYLFRDDARVIQPTVRKLEARGFRPIVSADVETYGDSGQRKIGLFFDIHDPLIPGDTPYSLRSQLAVGSSKQTRLGSVDEESASEFTPLFWLGAIAAAGVLVLTAF